MKFLRFLLVLIVPVVLFSCEGEEEPTPEDFLAVQKDGELWESEKAPGIWLVKGVLPGVDSLGISGHTQDGKLLMQLDFKGVGTYALPEAGYALFHNLVGGDVSTDGYYLNSDFPGAVVEITEWNPETKEIAGTFQFTLKKVYWGLPENATNAKETLQFTNGEFRGKVEEFQAEEIISSF